MRTGSSNREPLGSETIAAISGPAISPAIPFVAAVFLVMCVSLLVHVRPCSILVRALRNAREKTPDRGNVTALWKGCGARDARDAPIDRPDAKSASRSTRYAGQVISA
jgi:hypothetical protein